MNTERLSELLMEGKSREFDESIISLIKDKLPPQEILKECQAAMAIIGDKYFKGEIFLTEMFLAAQTFKQSFDSLKSILTVKSEVKHRGKVVIGTIEGDVHHIGKDIVAIVLESSGFEVINLGEDVGVETFVRAVLGEAPDALAMSCLITSAMLNMKRVIGGVRKIGEKVFIIIGGTAASEEFAKEIGADAYGRDPFEACRRLIEASGGWR